MAEDVMTKLPIRLTSELGTSEQEVVLGFKRDGNRFALGATATIKGDDGELQDVEVDLLMLTTDWGLYLHPYVWMGLGFPLGDDGRLKVMQGPLGGEEFKLVPAKEYKAYQKWLTGEEGKKDACVVEADGIEYQLVKDGSHMVKVIASGVTSGNLVRFSKKLGLERFQGINPKLGLKLDEAGRIEVANR